MRHFTIIDQTNPRFVVIVHERDRGCPGDRYYVEVRAPGFQSSVFIGEGLIQEIHERIEKEREDAPES